MSENPYQAPHASMGHTVQDSAAEETRTSLIKHEASVKSVGILYFIAAGILVMSGVGGLVSLLEN